MPSLRCNDNHTKMVKHEIQHTLKTPFQSLKKCSVGRELV